HQRCFGLVVEQLPGPVDDCLQGLMPFRRRSVSSAQKCESGGEVVEDRFRSQGACPCGGQFDGQWQTVEMVDEGGDRVSLDRHGRSRRSSSLDEELLGLGRRQLIEEVDVFGGVAQRCATGGQYPQLRHGGQQVVDQRGNSVDEVFAVV